MKAGRYNLPIIWRGSTYPTITFTWLDVNGDPLDLRGWSPLAKSENLDFHPQLVDAEHGVTSIGFSKDETGNFKLGVEQWDWIWIKDNAPLVNTVTVPYISGHVEIKEPVTKITPVNV